MFQIRYKDGGLKYARDKSGNIREFAKRQQARQYCRNNLMWADNVQIGLDDHWEPFWWNGQTAKYPN